MREGGKSPRLVAETAGRNDSPARLDDLSARRNDSLVQLDDLSARLEGFPVWLDDLSAWLEGFPVWLEAPAVRLNHCSSAAEQFESADQCSSRAAG